MEKVEKRNLMRELLTPELRQTLAAKTRYGADLEVCIKSGMRVAESEMGVIASDPDAYNVFGALFTPIIAHVHGFHDRHEEMVQPTTHFGDPNNPDLDLAKADRDGLILSTRVRVGRNLDGFAFSSFISKKARLEVEAHVQRALQSFPPHLQGHYRHLGSIGETERLQLINNHILYKAGDKFLEPAGVYRNWPEGRGLFTGTSGDLHIWVNEEDHIRVISMATGADLGHVYGTLIEAVESLSTELQFAHDRKLGYLTLCPSNLGTTLRASVLIRLRKVSALSNFRKLCAQLILDVRGTHGEQTDVEGDVYDVSNKRRLGLTENEAIRQMAHGVKVLLLLEQSL